GSSDVCSSDLALERRRLAGMEDLLPFREAIVGLEIERWRIEPVDPRQMAETVDAIAGEVEDVKKRVKRADAGKAVESDEEDPEEREAEESGAGPRQDAILPHPSSRDAGQSLDGSSGAAGQE